MGSNSAITSPRATVAPLGTRRVSVILNVGPVTCGTKTRVERTASSVPPQRIERDVGNDWVAGGDAGEVVREVPEGGFDPEQDARTAAHRTANAGRMQSPSATIDQVVSLDAKNRDSGCDG